MSSTEKSRAAQHSQFVRPSPLRTPPAPGYRAMGANKPTTRPWRVTMAFEADGQSDSYTVKVRASTEDESKDLALAALEREYGGGIDSIRFRFTPTRD